MESKITLHLNMKELSSLINLLHEKEQNMHLSMLTEDAELPLKRKLLDNLTEEQKEEFIRLEVKKVLSRATGLPVGNIGDKQSLTGDLHVNSLQIRALAVPFTNIARHFSPGAVVSADECEQCDTVNDCVELVVNKSK